MGVFLAVTVGVVLAMLYCGLKLATEWEPEARLTGICTLLWVCIAAYLFFAQWFPSKQHDSYSLVIISLISMSGYIVGRTLAFLTRRRELRY
jgi:uncharacterized membrane protein YhiD involved in acid resistance